MPIISGGVLFENGNEAPTDGRISKFITLFFGVPTTLKSIRTCCCGDREGCAFPASVALNALVLAVPEVYDKIIGAVAKSGLEYTIFISDRSNEGDPGASPIENWISLI